MHLAGTSSPMMVFDYYASNNSSSLFLGRKARGTLASPTSVLSNDALTGIGGRGYSATAFTTGSSAFIGIFAAENFTDTAQGAYITFETVPTGSTTRAERMRIDSSGNTQINSIAAGTTTTATVGGGYMGMPQVTATTGAATVAAADAGKHIYSTATRTITINSNANLALPVGTTIVFISGAGATTTIAITSDTMYLGGTGSTGSRTLAPHGMATAVKVASTTWYISGNGLT
jgi:hypothetical protein